MYTIHMTAIVEESLRADEEELRRIIAERMGEPGIPIGDMTRETMACDETEQCVALDGVADAHDQALETWLRDVVAPEYDRFLAGEIDCLSPDEARARLGLPQNAPA